MTGRCKHCPHWQLCIPGYSPHWGLNTDWTMRPPDIPTINGEQTFWLGTSCPANSQNMLLSSNSNTSIATLGPRWPLSLQPRPTVMSVGWIYASKWSPTWHFYFAPQPSGWELLSNNLPGSPELSGTRRVGVFDSAGLQEEPWCLHDFWLAPWE